MTAERGLPLKTTQIYNYVQFLPYEIGNNDWSISKSSLGKNKVRKVVYIKSIVSSLVYDTSQVAWMVVCPSLVNSLSFIRDDHLMFLGH